MTEPEGARADIGRDVPVLLLGFNRPDLIRRTFESVAKARPTRLFFAVDGPRAGRSQDMAQVRQVRSTVEAVNWPCDVRTLFAEQNQGCALAISRAITWFFGQVDEGIILEDDCLPDPSFFEFCRELLNRYRTDERVLMISGDNFTLGRFQTSYSYYFSKYTHIWSWATWARAWKLYDHSLAGWSTRRETGWLQDILNNERAARYWREIFDRTYDQRISSWAYRWQYACWEQGGLTIIPEVNMVSNIGFGGAATHTRQGKNPYADLPRSPIEFPLRHPASPVCSQSADGYVQRTHFDPGPVLRIRRLLSAL